MNKFLHTLATFKRPLLATALAAATTMTITFAAAPGTAVSLETLANTTTASAQVSAAVARDADGDYVVVWQSPSALDAAGDIFLQRFNHRGVAQGGETRVNTTVTGLQSNPAVAMDAAGNFVVVWESDGQDSSGRGVFLQRYNNQGVVQGSETRVNTFVTNHQENPVVAMAPNGAFVVAWQSLTQDGSGQGVFAQRYDTAGAPSGSEFRANATTDNSQRDPAVAMDVNGNFIIVWQSNIQIQDGDLNGIFAQRYMADGSALGAETRLNNITTGDQTRPAVAMRATGAFVAAWMGPDSSSTGIWARRFDNTGQALDTTEVLVNTTPADTQAAPTIAVDVDGGAFTAAVIAWESFSQSPPDSAGTYGIFTQRFDSNGVALGGEALVNVTTTGDQRAPALAADADGDFVVAWQGEGTGDTNGIFTRRYAGPEVVDLAITKTDSPDPATAGGPLTYTITVSNTHPASTATGVPVVDSAVGSATNLVIRDTLPANVTVTSTAGTNWTCPNPPITGSFTCTYTAVLNAGTATSSLTLQATAPSLVPGRMINNTAQIDSVDQSDTNSTNNTAVQDTAVCEAGSSPGTFKIDNASSAEPPSGQPTVTVTVTRSDSCGTATVDFATANNSATAGLDYTATSGTLTFVNDVTSRDISVTILGDDLDENNEIFRVNLSNPVRGNFNPPTGDSSADITIIDNDDPPTAAFAAASSTVSEGAGTHAVSVTLNRVSGRTVVIPFASPGDGTATKGGAESDYTTSPAGTTDNELTIPAGSLTGTITLNLVNDVFDEPDEETVILTLGNHATFDAGTPNPHTATITDNDASPAVSFAAAASSDAEGTASRNAQVTLSAASRQEVRVAFAVTGGTATQGAGNDYTGPMGSPLTFAPGETSKNITITVNDDALDENDETVAVTLSSPNNATLGANPTHTYTITDDDLTPSVTFSAATQTVTESGTATVTLTLTNALGMPVTSGRDVTVPYTLSGTATNNTDYTTTPLSPAIIPAGSSSTTITVTLVDDALDENDETAVLTMGTPINATQGTNTTHTLTITDNEGLPEVFFVVASQSASETAGSVTAEIRLSPVSGRTVTVNYNTTGSTASTPADYSLSPASSVTFAAGETSKLVTITIVNDVDAEANETVKLNLASPSNATLGTQQTQQQTHTLTIQDNDAVPQVFFTTAAQTVGENGVSVTATISLSRPADSDATISYTLMGTATGADFSVAPASPIVIAQGEQTKVLTISISDDRLDENDETAIVRLSSAVNATIDLAQRDHTVTITDNDTAGVTVTQSGGNTNVTEGGGSDTYTLVLNSQPTSPVTITLSYGGDLSTSPASTVTFSTTTGAADGWNTPQTVTVTAVDDALVEGNETPSITHSSSSGDLLYSGIPVASVPVNVTDNDAAAVSVTESGGATLVSEAGATDSYTLVLTAQPASDVTVTVMADSQVRVASAGAPTPSASLQLTFTNANWNTAQTVTVSAVNDSVDESDPHSGLITHTTSSADGNFNNLVVNNVTPQIADNDSVGLVFSTASVSVAEAGAAGNATDTYTVRLNSQPTANVTVALDAGSQLSASPTTLTFTPLTGMPGGWDVPQAVTVSAVDDDVDEANPHSGMVTHSASSSDPGYNIATAGVVTASIADEDTAGVSITPTTVAVSEGDTAGQTYSIVLTSEPVMPVTVALSVNNGQVLASPTQVVFNSGNWNTAQSITVTAVDDNAAEGNHSSSISHAATSSDPNYDGRAVSSVTANITDNDAADIVLVQTGGNTAVIEGDTGDSYSVRLNSQPAADVTVSLSFSASGQIVADPVMLTFTSSNYATGQSVTVSPVEDAAIEGNHSVTITHTSSSADPVYQGIARDLSVAITDNDATVSISPTSVTKLESETSVTFTLTRTGSTIQVASVDYATANGTATAGEDYTAATGTATFAANDDTETFTVTLTPDAVDEAASETFTVNLSNPTANKLVLGASSSTVTITDDDAAGVTVTQSGGTTAVTEGGATDSYTLALTSQPTANVTITLNAGSQLTANPATVTFTPANYGTPQTVTVSAIDDALAEGSHTGAITHSVASSDSFYNGIAVAGVSAAITDNDTAGVRVTESGGSTQVTEGGATDTLTVQLTSQPTANVTITLTSSSQLTISPTTLTFTPANYNTPQTVTVTAVNDDQVEGTHSGTLSGSVSSADARYNLSLGTVTVTITDNDSVTAGDEAPAVVVTHSGGSVNVVTSSKKGGGALSWTSLLGLLSLLAFRRAKRPTGISSGHKCGRQQFFFNDARRCRIGLKTMLAFLAFAPASALAQNPSQSLLQGLSYSNVDFRYVLVSVDDPSVDASGFSLAGSRALGKQGFVSVSYSAMETDDFAALGATGSSKTNTSSLGFGAHRPLQPGLDLTGSVSVVFSKAEGQGGFSGSADDTGYGLEAGLRGIFSPSVEWGAAVSYVAIFDDSDTGLSFQALYRLSPRYSLAAGGGFSDNSTQFNLGARYNFWPRGSAPR